ncbi:hypothetical protein F5Y12DRAFT_783137 [Xylaria sp. FL1777]|nr:hypothetical protein F5Y12DRAFT_783137 [Xylaria sp. FL1777]
MLTTATVNHNSFFHPMGDTPAVSLTQSMPPSVPTDVLLLGCGDVRNILFTCHVNGRRMDITCCDNQKAIIARNILLLSLIIDDKYSQNENLLWDIYYHMYLDEKALDLLRSQAQKLYDLSASSSKWQRSQYGSSLRYCDYATLLSVRNIWSFYCTANTKPDLKRLFESALERAKSRRSNLDYLTGFRSAVPVQGQATKDLDTLHRHYWKYRSTNFNAKARAAATHPNPTFLTGEEDVTIHHCTNPLFGFHLAMAYVPIHPDDAELGKLHKLHQLVKTVEVARIEFRQWMLAYRQSLVDIKIRFFIGDAIALAYTIQHKRDTTENTAHWYQNRYSLQPLVLNGSDYVSNTAPLDFDVIDTSNLCDHVGSWTLLTATAPLLRCHSSSTLFTEFLLKSSETYRDGLDSMLGGHVPTLSTLLGLFPAEYWTNTSSISLGDEGTLNAAIAKNSKDKEDGSRNDQMFLRTCWKSKSCMLPTQESCPKPTRIKFYASELAHVLYQIYANMFADKGNNPIKYSGIETPWHSSHISCHHASFASFLRLVQTRFVCDWNAVMRLLLALIEKRCKVPIVKDYMHELYTYLHIMDIFSVDAIKQWSGRKNNLALPPSRIAASSERWGDLRDSDDMPPVVCLILEVPRKKLAAFTKMNRIALGIPVVHCIVQVGNMNSPRVFSAWQLTFGDISTSGEVHDKSFEVSVAEDHAGWNGQSPLIAVFYLPAFLLKLRAAEVFLGIHSTPEFVATVDSILASGTNIPETTVDEVGAVYITRYAPNQTGFPIATGFIKNLPASPINAGAISSLLPDVDPETGQILGQTLPLVLYFPVFFSGEPIPVIDRESFQIEVSIQVADNSKWAEWYRHMYPVHLQERAPINWNLPYIKLAKCPKIDISQRNKLQWLWNHLSMAISSREWDMREKKTYILPEPSNGELVRLDFTDTLYTIFDRFSHPSAKRWRGFSFRSITDGIVQFYILITSLRLNLSDRAVVLDCAVSTAPGDLKGPRLEALAAMGVLSIGVTDEHMQLWRQVLPAYVERCRTWAHHVDCDYATSGKIPLATQLGKRFLCACGNGQFPADFNTHYPSWHMIRKYFVRAAISPAFLAPFAGHTYCPASDLYNSKFVRLLENRVPRTIRPPRRSIN